MKQHQSRQGGKQKLREMLSSLMGLVLTCHAGLKVVLPC